MNKMKLKMFAANVFVIISFAVGNVPGSTVDSN